MPDMGGNVRTARERSVPRVLSAPGAVKPLPPGIGELQCVTEVHPQTGVP
jgi:hypothetical protein